MKKTIFSLVKNGQVDYDEVNRLNVFLTQGKYYVIKRTYTGIMIKGIDRFIKTIALAGIPVGVMIGYIIAKLIGC